MLVITVQLKSPTNCSTQKIIIGYHELEMKWNAAYYCHIKIDSIQEAFRIISTPTHSVGHIFLKPALLLPFSFLVFEVSSSQEGAQLKMIASQSIFSHVRGTCSRDVSTDVRVDLLLLVLFKCWFTPKRKKKKKSEEIERKNTLLKYSVLWALP